MKQFIQVKILESLVKREIKEIEEEVTIDGKPTGEKIKRQQEIEVPYVRPRVCELDPEGVSLYFEAGEKNEHCLVEHNGQPLKLAMTFGDFKRKMKEAGYKTI